MRDHLLIQLKTGDQKLRHCIVVGILERLSHRVLTPTRQVRLQDFSDDAISRILPCDGVTLPRTVSRSDCHIDLDSAAGAFSSDEVERAIAMATRREAGALAAAPAAAAPAVRRR